MRSRKVQGIVGVEALEAHTYALTHTLVTLNMESNYSYSSTSLASYVANSYMVLLSQVIVIPCGISASLSADERLNVFSQCERFIKEMNAAGIRCRGDFKDNYSPGWKFNHWELKVDNYSAYICKDCVQRAKTFN